MLKIIRGVLFFAAFVGGGLARAQTGGLDEPALRPEKTEAGPLDDKYLTPTGETVPHPGESQSGGETPLDRAIEKQDNEVDQSICKDC